MTRASLRRRLEAVEARDGEGVARTYVLLTYGRHADGEPLGVKVLRPALPAMDRAPGEPWPQFLARVGGMLPERASLVVLPAKDDGGAGSVHARD